jgi:deoxycytidine triphosphate deaminase
MILATTTDVIGQLGQITTGLFSDFQSPIILIVGMIFGFLVFETLTGTLYKSRGDYKGIYDNDID